MAPRSTIGHVDPRHGMLAFVNMALYLPAQLAIVLGVLQEVSAEVGTEVVDPVA